MERFPQLLIASLEDMIARLEYLRSLGLTEAQLGQVQYCLLCSYAFESNIQMCTPSKRYNLHSPSNQERIIEGP